MQTIGDLKKAIADLPDDAPIIIKPHDGVEFQANPWRYQTREVTNAYRCNDDRYTQNQVLCIELSPISDSP